MVSKLTASGWAWRVLGAWLVAGVSITGLACGSGEEVREGAAENGGRLIDLQAGSYGGVGIGDSEADMIRVFGSTDPASLNETASPLGETDGRGPHDFNPWPGKTKPRWFRYESVAFFLSNGEVSVVMVTDPHAHTTNGLKMGASLDAVKAANGVGEIRCGVVNEGTEYEPYRACSGKTTSGHYVWFGGDSLANITMGTVPLEGV